MFRARLYQQTPTHSQEQGARYWYLRPFTSVCCQKQHHRHPSVINYRKWKYFDEVQFRTDLLTSPWTVLDMYDNPDDAVQFFTQTFLEVVNTHIPWVSKRVKRQMHPQ